MSEADGSGDAFDAGVSLDAHPRTTDVADIERIDAEDAVASAAAKVERQKEHLAGAKQALAEAKAALAKIRKG